MQYMSKTKHVIKLSSMTNGTNNTQNSLLHHCHVSARNKTGLNTIHRNCWMEMTTYSGLFSLESSNDVLEHQARRLLRCPASTTFERPYDRQTGTVASSATFERHYNTEISYLCSKH